jgi:hypothetical protein
MRQRSNICMHQPGRAASDPHASMPQRPARPAGDACVMQISGWTLATVRSVSVAYLGSVWLEGATS